MAVTYHAGPVPGRKKKGLLRQIEPGKWEVLAYFTSDDAYNRFVQDFMKAKTIEYKGEEKV